MKTIMENYLKEEYLFNESVKNVLDNNPDDFMHNLKKIIACYVGHEFIENNFYSLHEFYDFKIDGFEICFYPVNNYFFEKHYIDITIDIPQMIKEVNAIVKYIGNQIEFDYYGSPIPKEVA